MRSIWNPKFILANLIILAVLQILLGLPGFQFAALLSGESPFSAQQVVAATNQFRAGLGIDSLRSSATLNVAAAQKLQDMALNEYFAHFSPSGISPWHWFAINNYAYSYAGENLAIGFVDADSTVQAWAQSASHRKNLANQNYREIGVAVRQVTLKDIQGTLVVQLFGTPAAGIQVSGASAAASPTPRPRTILGFSQGNAQETDLPLSPTPSPVSVKVSPEFSPNPAPQENIASSSAPLAISTAAPVRRLVGGTLARIFSIYTIALTLAAVAYLIFVEIRRDLVLKTAAYAAIAIISVLTLPGALMIGHII